MDYFRQCSCLETNPCVLVFTISLTLKGAATATKCETQWPTFQILLFGTTKNFNEWVYKHIVKNINCSFIPGMVENYCTLGKIQHWHIHLGPMGLGE